MPAALAGVEMGGTKCICILGRGPDDIREQQRVPTTDPASTLEAIAQVLERWSAANAGFEALGLAAFGPLDLRRGSRTYGHLETTPKPHWAGVDLAGFFAGRLRTRTGTLPIGITTDVIGAALAEGRWGAARGLADYAYVTVGTGVGVGIVSGGTALIGCHHPELGHVRVVRAAGDDWPGNCRYHGACVEGLASGSAIEARSGGPAAQLAEDSPIWDLVAHALGQLAHTLVLSVAPQRILIGGGVALDRPQIFPRIRASLAVSLNGYLDIPEVTSALESYIVPPGLGARAGPLGALAVAQDTAERAKSGRAAL
jgi:fructokinase